VLGAFGRPGQLGYPRGIAVDPADGTLWVADMTKGRVTHWRTDGTFLGALPTTVGTADDQLLRPFGVAADKERVYVADTPAHKVKVFTKAGRLVTVIGGRGKVNGKLLEPSALAMHHGRLYICEEGNERISIFNLRQSG